MADPGHDPLARSGRPARERRHDGRRFEGRRSAERDAYRFDRRDPDRRDPRRQDADSRDPEPRRPRLQDADRRDPEPREPHRAAVGFRAEAYLDQRDYAAELADDWDTSLAVEPVVIEYPDSVDEEEIWGPRPRLHANQAGGRRTVVITGRGGDRAMVPRGHSRDHLPIHARHGFQADRTAMWAVLLCVIVLLAAIASH